MIQDNLLTQRLKIKPVEKWVYCKDKDYTCYENILIGEDIYVRFDKPILEVSVDKFIAIRTTDEIALIDKSGKIVWKKKIKANAIRQFGDVVLVGVGKKLVVFDTNGDKIKTKKVGANIRVIDAKEEIVVASDKGLHAFNLNYEKIWELNLSGIITIKIDFFIAVAVKNEIVMLTPEGDILWRKVVNGLVYKIEFEEDGVKVYLFENSVIKFSLEGDVVEITQVSYDFKFLPLPWIVVRDKLNDLKELIKSAKELKPKVVSKLYKEAEKLYRKGEYGSAYELIEKAKKLLRELQLVVKIPKKVYLGKEFKINVYYKNVVDEVVEDLKVDLTDLEKYFELSTKILEFPPIKKNMFVSEEVKAIPKYEGLFRVEIDSKSNVGEVKREFYIRVVRSRFDIFSKLKLKRKEKEEKGEESLLELLK
jgi:hypothetical protein